MENKPRTKTITLGKKDVIIAIWVKKVKEENEVGKLSFLIKQALSYYVRNKTFICVGKVCLKHMDDVKENIRVNCWMDDIPEVVEWLNSLAARHLKQNSVIRDILKHSIEIVEDESEEWIPSYVDVELQINKGIQSGQAIQSDEVKVNDVNIIKTTEESKEEKKRTENTPKKHRKMSKAQALLGTSHKNTNF